MCKNFFLGDENDSFYYSFLQKFNVLQFKTFIFVGNYIKNRIESNFDNELKNGKIEVHINHEKF